MAAVLVLTGAVMAVYAASPESEEAVTSTQSEEGVATSQQSKDAFSNDIYIVQLRAEPIATYAGGVAGLRATAPAKGQKIARDAAEVKAYADHLRAQQDAVLNRVGGEKIYSYTVTVNGFAAKLTAQQAEAMRAHDDVISVEKDQIVHADTASTPDFLGLTAPGGLWSQQGGGGNTTNGPGENMIIGVLDTGIWPENPSFSDRDGNGVVVYPPVVGFTGTCPATSSDGSWDATDCNNKIVGARHFNAAWGGDAGIDAMFPHEFTSPRDYGGHGSHTASTAGGNNGVQVDGPGAGLGRISGMAPRARISVYKVLWQNLVTGTASGRGADLIAAIDQAVTDGVDVINYSISGTQTNFREGVQVAFMRAAEAGVFVAASAGNSGPTTSTVAHPGPWLTTVAAGTHNRSGVGSVTLGNGVTYSGASIAAAVGPAPFIRSTDAGLAGANPDFVRLCYAKADNGGNPVLDPAKVNGKIVLCERGVTARVNKSLAVSEAGGVGVVLANPSANSLNADFHYVPTVHVSHTDYPALIAYSGTANPTARINQSTITFTEPAPFTAAFSSRGPLQAGGGDLLKPDVIAPGQDIVAAVAPPNNGGLNFSSYQGTSMSAPHVAGIAALLKQQHPTWSPMMIKSALMTTGTNVIDTGVTEATRIFRQGAGHIVPNNANNPGLVYDSNISDWNAFLCGTNPGSIPQATCNALVAAGYSTNPSNLNTPSIAIGDLVGPETVRRTVTNVSGSTVTYTASLSAPAGVNTVVSPTSLTLNPGQSGTFTVSFSRTTAAFNTFVGGQLTWTGGGRSVRIPIVVRPVSLAVASTASSNGSAINMPVRFGYDGPFSATPRGMIAATLRNGTVSDDPNDNFTPGGPGTVSFDVVVPAGTTYARFSLFNEHTDGNEDDLDLHVYRVSTNTLVVETGGATSNEEANMVNPAADTYRVWVHGFETDGPDANFTLFYWVLGTAAERNMYVLSPWQATAGGSASMHVRFANLAANTKYLGSIAYSGATGFPNPKIVRVDTPATFRTEAQLVEIASSRTHGALGERELLFPAGSAA